MTDDSTPANNAMARQFASDDLEYVRHALGADRWDLGYILNHMQSAVDWAVDAWLAARGEKPHSSWPDQEGRFLLVAPRALQKDYLRIAGDVTRLAGALLDIMNTDCLADVAMDAPILAPWRDQARAWLKDAGEWVAMLTDPGAANHLPAARHVDHGRLQGHFAGLTANSGPIRPLIP
jgi:hypothetical protein